MSEKVSLPHDVMSAVDGGQWSTSPDPTYLAPTAAHTARYVKHGHQAHSRSSSPPKSKDYDLMTVHLKDLRHVGHIHHRNCCLPNDDNPNAVLSFVSEDKPKRFEWNPSTYVKKEKGPSILAHPKAVHLRERVLDASDKNRGSLFGTHPDNIPTLWNNSFHIGDGANLVNTARHPSTRLYFGDPDRDVLNPSAGTIVNNHMVTVLPPQPLCSKTQHSRTRRRQGAAREALLGLGADYSYSRTVNMLGEQCAEVPVTTVKSVRMGIFPERSPDSALSAESELVSGMTVLNAMYGPSLRQRHTQRSNKGVEGCIPPHPSARADVGAGTDVVEEQAQALLSEHTQALEHHRRARARAHGALGDATDSLLTTSPPSLAPDVEDTQRSLVTGAERAEVDTSHFLGLAYLSPSERGHTVQALTFSQTRSGGQTSAAAAGVSGRGGVCVLADEERVPDAAQLRPHVHAEDARIAALTRMAAPVENEGKRPWDARVFRPLGASEDESTSLGWCTTMGVSETENGALKPAETFRSLGNVVSAWPMVPGVVHGTVSAAQAGMVRRAHEAQGGYVGVMLRDTAESALATLVRRGVVRERGGTQANKRGKHGGLAGAPTGDRSSRGGKGGYTGMGRGNGGKGAVNVDDENYTELAQKLHTLALRERGWDTTLVQDVTPPPFVLKRHVLATRHGEVAPDIHSSFGGSASSLDGYARPANHRAEIGAVAPDAIDYLSLPPLPQLHQQMQTQTPAQAQQAEGDAGEEAHSGIKGPEKAKTRRGKKAIPKVIAQLLDLNNARYNVLSALSIHKHPYPFAHLRRDARAWLREALRDHKIQLRQAKLNAHRQDGRSGLDVESNTATSSSSGISASSPTSAPADLARTSAALRRALVAAKHEEEMEAADMYRQRAGIHDFDTLEDRTAGVRQEPAPVSKYKAQWQPVAGREDLAKNGTNTTAKTRAKVRILKKLTPGQKRLRAAATAVLRRLQGMGPSPMLNSARISTRTGKRHSSSRGTRLHTINWTPIGTLPDASVLEHELVRDATAVLDATRPLAVPLPAPVPVSVDRSVALAHLQHPTQAQTQSLHPRPPTDSHPHAPIDTSGAQSLACHTTPHAPDTTNATYARDDAPPPSPRAGTNTGMQRGGWRSTDLVKPRLRRGVTSDGTSTRSNARRALVPLAAHTSEVDRLRLRAGWQGVGSGKGAKPGEGTGIYRDATSIHTQYSNMMMDEPVLDLASLRTPNGDFAIQKRIRESGRTILQQQAIDTQAEVYRLEQLLAELRSRSSRASSAATKTKDMESEQELVRARAEALERLVMLRDAHAILGNELRNPMNATSHDTIVEHLLPETVTTEKSGMGVGVGVGTSTHGSALSRVVGERKPTDLDTINSVYSVDPRAGHANAKPRATIAIAAARKQEKQARLAALRAENSQNNPSHTNNITTSSTLMSTTAPAMSMFDADAYSYEDDGVDMPMQPRYILPQELKTQRAATTPMHMHMHASPRPPVVQLFPSLGDNDAEVYAQQLHAAIQEQESHPYYRQKRTKTHGHTRPSSSETNATLGASADPIPVPVAFEDGAMSVGGTGSGAGAGSDDIYLDGGDAGLSSSYPPPARPAQTTAATATSPPLPPSTTATMPSPTSPATTAPASDSATTSTAVCPSVVSGADAVALASAVATSDAPTDITSRPMSSTSTTTTMAALSQPLPSSATTDTVLTHNLPSVATNAAPTPALPYVATDPTCPPQQPPGFTVMLAEPPSAPIGVDMGVRVYVALPPRQPSTRVRSRTPARAHVPPSAFSEDVSETTVGSPRPLTQEERQRVAVEGPFVPQVTRVTPNDDDPVRTRANITSPPPGSVSSSASPAAAGVVYDVHHGAAYVRGMGAHPPSHTRISPRAMEYPPDVTVGISPRSRSRGQSPIIGTGARATPISAGVDRRVHARTRPGQHLVYTPERVSRRGTPSATTTNTPTTTISTTPAPTGIPPSYTYPYADVEAEADETDRLTPLPQFTRHSSRKSSKHKRSTRSASRGRHSPEKASRPARGTGAGTRAGKGVSDGSRGTSTANGHADGIRGSLTKSPARNAVATASHTLPIITSQYRSSGKPVNSRPTTLMSTSVSSSSSAPTSASASQNLPHLRVYYHEQYEAPVKHTQPSTAMFTLAKREGEMQDAWSAYDGAIAKALER